ncbi:MAG: hypothetical protein LBO09_04215 [Candidatus Peribacteria bacterium]|jgi:flagellar basal body-associated protein FliL|nr:hypothetical protein [Candidatus Peribacteria bacterium]
MVTTRTRKIIIRIIVILFLLSSGLTFVSYLISPSADPQPTEDPSNLEEYVDLENNVEVVTPNEEIDVNAPGNNEVQVVVNEDETKNEENPTIVVTLPDGSQENLNETDLTDNLQLSK